MNLFVEVKSGATTKRVTLGAAGYILVVLSVFWSTDLVWPHSLVLYPKARTAVWQLTDGRAVLTVPRTALIAEVATFNDQLLAYFNYDWLRVANASNQVEVLLTSKKSGERTSYPILLYLENDLLTALPLLAGLRQEKLIPGFQWRFTSYKELRRLQRQTQVFVAAYNFPVQRRLEDLSPAELQDYVSRFVFFKSRTDRRVRERMAPVPPTLSESEARRLAADIVTVAHFFSLPLDFFLGIGAMENNYMDVPGDLDHVVWKRHPQRGDIVLRRRRNRALVRNNAIGLWQITRETMRYAHKLYLEGTWDYSLLPQQLRPPQEFSPDHVSVGQLTTYAGLLFRDLLHRFQGNVGKAVGAYNGGPRKPNMQYEEGVRLVASYARRMIEQAARLDGQVVADMSFFTAARR